MRREEANKIEEEEKNKKQEMRFKKEKEKKKKKEKGICTQANRQKLRLGQLWQAPRLPFRTPEPQKLQDMTWKLEDSHQVQNLKPCLF